MQEPEAVHVIDDDPSLRRALDRLFRSIDLDVRTYGSVAEFLSTPKSDARGCLVLDVRLPGVNGLDFQSQMAAHDLSMPVILISGHGDIPMSVRAMKAGAVDFLTKPFQNQELLAAVAQGIELDRTRRAAKAQHSGVDARVKTLTKREREVVAMVTTGKMNKQVAAELGLSEITVKVHRGTAMRKMGAKSLAELVLMMSHHANPAESSTSGGDVRPTRRSDAGQDVPSRKLP